jgi:PIN domain nuclease of toxin-antitoxin system
VIVLDTHVWIRWLNTSDENRNLEWHVLVSNADRVAISAISLFEVAWLQRHNRISLTLPLSEWFVHATSGSGIEVIPLTSAIAESAVNLPEHHSDPQDRIIMATAITHGAKLLSADKKFIEYAELKDSLVRI